MPKPSSFVGRCCCCLDVRNLCQGKIDRRAQMTLHSRHADAFESSKATLAFRKSVPSMPLFPLDTLSRYGSGHVDLDFGCASLNIAKNGNDYIV